MRAGREVRDHLAQHPSFTGGETEAPSHFPRLHSRTGTQSSLLLPGPLLLHPICSQTVCLVQTQNCLLSMPGSWQRLQGHWPPRTSKSHVLDAAGRGTRVPRGQEPPCQIHKHTHTHSHSLSRASVAPLSLWPHGDYLPCLFFFCSSSSPGTPGIPRKVLCEFPYHTSSSWSGGIICREGGKRRSGRQQPGSGGVPSQPGGAVLVPTMEMWIQSQPQERHTWVPFLQAISGKLHRHGRP